MIDDDFHPDRIQMRAVGILLDIAHRHPETPAITEADLYNRVFERKVEMERQEWLQELQSFGLIAIRHFSSMIGGKRIEQEPRVSITPAGAFYAISRASMFAENARTPTDDFPDEIIETPYAIQSYFAALERDFAPASDRIVPLDHNSLEYREAIQTLDNVAVALRDNELGAMLPTLRDEKLEELRAIRRLLDNSEVSASKLQILAWSTLGFLAAEFASKPVGFAAEQAWQAILRMIGAN